MLSMRGFTTVCIIIQLESSLKLKENTFGLALKNLKWMKKWQEEAGDNQLFIRQQWKYITISRVPSEESS
jgi:hypothetical protein